MNAFFRHLGPLFVGMFGIPVIPSAAAPSTQAAPHAAILIIDFDRESVWTSRAQSLSSYTSLERLVLPPNSATSSSEKASPLIASLGTPFSAQLGPIAVLVSADSPALPALEKLQEQEAPNLLVVRLPPDPGDLATVVSLLDSYHSLLNLRSEDSLSRLYSNFPCD